jgi:NADH-quinone oxidoreductase subunit E
MVLPIAAILERHERLRDALIPILQDVQREMGYVSEESVAAISRYLRISENEVFGVSTFYAQFRFTEPGRHSVKVCLGTACHVRGGGSLLDSLENGLGIGCGEAERRPRGRAGKGLRPLPRRPDRREDLQQDHGQQTHGAIEVL